ncbi:hypothetical protein AAVH_09917 [Aphelenchoides avenae]|nr:hypothetical protein AAVH_09917 [Aphelenchus avenae]
MAHAELHAARIFEVSSVIPDLDGQIQEWNSSLEDLSATHEVLVKAIDFVERRLSAWRDAIEKAFQGEEETPPEAQLWTEYDQFRDEHQLDQKSDNWTQVAIGHADQKKRLLRKILEAKSRLDAADADQELNQVLTTARAENQAIITLDALSGASPAALSAPGSSQVSDDTNRTQGTPASPDPASTDATTALGATAPSGLVTSRAARGHSAAGGDDLSETVTIDTDMSARTMFRTKRPGAGFRHIPVSNSPGPRSGANATNPAPKRVTIAADAARHTTFGSVNDTIPPGAPRHSTPKVEPREFSFSPTNAFYANERTLNTIRNSTRNAAPSVHAFKGGSFKKFSGDPGEFPRFIDRFLLIVERQDPPLLDHQKLEFLAEHLDGAPRELVNNFDLTDQNYEEACNMLAERRADSLLHFYDSVMPLVIQLQQHGVDLSGDSAYTEEVLNKIDPKFLTDKIIERADEPHIVSLREAMDWLKYAADTKSATVEARGGTVPSNYVPNPRSDKRNPANAGKPFRNQGFSQGNRSGKDPPDLYGRAFAAHNANQNEDGSSFQSKFRCSLCTAVGHYPTDCPQYTTAVQRIARVRELGFCRVCLRKEQWKGQCQGHHVKCKHCKRGYHHLSLCGAREKLMYKYNNRQTDGHPYNRRGTPPPQRRNADRRNQDQFRPNQGRTARTYSTSVEHERLSPESDEESCYSEPDFDFPQHLYDELEPEDFIPIECKEECCCGECDPKRPEQDDESSDEDSPAHCLGGIIPNGKNRRL